jgi:hypothetical protein
MIAIFWLWILISLATWAVSLIDGSLHEMMLAAVDISGVDPSIDRNDMAKAFIWISLAYFAFSVLIGGLLVHFATKARRWAVLLLIPCAIWWGYESVSFPFATSEMYPDLIDWSYWLTAVLGGLVWSSILAFNLGKLRVRAL